MPKITEIIPDEIFDDPDLWNAFESGQLFTFIVSQMGVQKADIEAIRTETVELKAELVAVNLAHIGEGILKERIEALRTSHKTTIEMLQKVYMADDEGSSQFIELQEKVADCLFNEMGWNGEENLFNNWLEAELQAKIDEEKQDG